MKFKFMISDSGIMTETIQAALSPLLIIGSICGVGLFEYPLGRLRPYFSCLYFLTTWSFFIYLFHYLINTNYTKFMFITWTTVLTILITIVSILVSLLRFKELKACLHKLSTVDDTLEVLGIPKQYRKLYNLVIRIIMVWLVLALSMGSIGSVWMNYESPFNIAYICISFVANHFHNINTLIGIIWGITLGQVHLQLCFISRELNKVFNIQLTLQMASYYITSINMARLIYTLYINKNINRFGHFLDGLFVYIWAVLFNAKLLVLNHICQTVCDKASKTIAILQKLSNDSSDEDLREQTLQFILQIKQRELKLSGMGLFNFGYNFIRRYYMSAASILVIIIQMHMAFKYPDNTLPTSSEN